MASKVQNPGISDNDEDSSDIELEGMDLDDDVDMEPVGESNMLDAPADDDDTSNAHTSSQPQEVSEKLATDDHDELEAAHRERTELMAAERKKVSAPTDEAASVEDKLHYLLAQSEVFGHFLAGTMATTGKKRGGGKKNGSRGKKNRMSEAEEDAQLLKTAESKRSVIRLDKQVRARHAL